MSDSSDIEETTTLSIIRTSDAIRKEVNKHDTTFFSSLV